MEIASKINNFCNFIAHFIPVLAFCATQYDHQIYIIITIYQNIYIKSFRTTCNTHSTTIMQLQVFFKFSKKNFTYFFLYFQFVVTPANLEKSIKLQLPIMLATYPLRNEDGTLRRKNKIDYPTTLPIFRPWLDEKTFQ